jgi:hypothetical protein
MPFSDAPYNRPTRDRMTAALETAWLAVRLSLAPPEIRRGDMVAAILDAAAVGERDFLRFQQKALDALGACEIEPVERRQRPRLVRNSDG